MSEKNIINIEESQDIKQREQKNKRQEEIIKLIMRQTNYTKEQCETKILEWNNNYLNVIKEYIKIRKNVDVNPTIDVRSGKMKAIMELQMMTEMATYAVGWLRGNLN